MVGKITKKSTRKQWRSPEGIQRRNEAERARVKATNEAFENLRKFIPNGEFKGKKKSKLETLQTAIEHINNLMMVLNEPIPEISVHNLSLPEMPSFTYTEPVHHPMFPAAPQIFEEYSEHPVNYSISSNESLNFSVCSSGYGSSPSKDFPQQSFYQENFYQHYRPY